MILKHKLNLNSGIQSAKHLLAIESLPDAIFTVSDYAAMGAMQELKNQGVNIPGDVAIVGFSNEVFTSFVEPSLSTVDQHTHAMGKSAANLFLGKIQKKDTSEVVFHKMLLQPELIVRKSSVKS